MPAPPVARQEQSERPSRAPIFVGLALLVWIVLMMTGLPLSTPSPGGGTTSSTRLKAVATVGMIGDVVEQVGGPCVAVSTLMGPGVDPHVYRASARDARDLQAADVIFYAGLSLEGQLSQVLERLAERRPTVAVAERAVPEELRARTDDGSGVDPHVWMDVSLWARTVDVVQETLSLLAPECASAMSARAAAYREQLHALDQWVRDSVASLPPERRVLVTAHDAFFYYGRAYGFEVHGIQGISTEAEAGLADIRAVTDLVVARDIPALFVETSINPRNIEAVQAAVRARGREVAIGGELFSDALGNAGTWQGTYIGMLVHNTKTIVEALGGQVAPLPEDLAEWAARWQVPLPVAPAREER